VDPAISRAIVESEMERSAPIAATFGWLVERDPGGLIVRVGMRSAVDEQQGRAAVAVRAQPVQRQLHPVGRGQSPQAHS